MAWGPVGAPESMLFTVYKLLTYENTPELCAGREGQPRRPMAVPLKPPGTPADRVLEGRVMCFIFG